MVCGVQLVSTRATKQSSGVGGDSHEDWGKNGSPVFPDSMKHDTPSTKQLQSQTGAGAFKPDITVVNEFGYSLGQMVKPLLPSANGPCQPLGTSGTQTWDVS